MPGSQASSRVTSVPTASCEPPGSCPCFESFLEQNQDGSCEPIASSVALELAQKLLMNKPCFRLDMREECTRPALSGAMDWWRMEWPFSRV